MRALIKCCLNRVIDTVAYIQGFFFLIILYLLRLRMFCISSDCEGIKQKHMVIIYGASFFFFFKNIS